MKALLHQLELSFWDTFIPLMNKSPSVRYIVPRLYRLLHIKEFQDTLKYTVILTIVGLILGFIGSLASDLIEYVYIH